MLNKQLLKNFFITTVMLDFLVAVFVNESENHFTNSVFPTAVMGNSKPKGNIDDHQIINKNQKCPLVGCDGSKRNLLPICYCDPLCKKYNDCCYGALSTKISGPVINIDGDLNSTLTCENEIFYDKHFGVLMVSECPSSYHLSEVWAKCKESESIYPVTAVNGISFRNMYCAFCHNISQYTAWSFQYKMIKRCLPKYMNALNTTIPSQIEYIVKNKCPYQFDPPLKANIRSCFTHAIKNNSDNPMCSKFQEPVVINNKLYRNIFCINRPINIHSSNRCLRYLRLSDEENRQYGDLLLTSIFNVRPVFKMSGRKICNEHNSYVDTITDTCKTDVCRITQNEECHVELLKNLRWTLKLKFVTDNFVDKGFTRRLVTFIFLSISKEKYKTIAEYLIGYIQCGRNVFQNDQKCCFGNLIIVFKNLAAITKVDASVYKSNVKNMIWRYREINGKSITTATEVSGNVTDICNITNIPTHAINMNQPVWSEFVMDSFAIPLKAIPKTIYGVTIIKQKNGSEPEYRLKWEKLIFDNTPTNNKTTSESKPDNIWSLGTIITYVTLGLSCCTLMITLCIYIYLDLLNSASGIISKHLIINMLAAQLLFITVVGADYDKVICSLIGIISHYFWLASFSWITVFLYNIFYMTRTMKKYPGSITNKNQKVSKVIYIFGYLVPLGIVFPCVLLDIFTEIKFDYNGGNICFVSSFLANLLSFTVPVLFSILINIVILITTSIQLSRYNHSVTSLAPIQQTRALIPIYIKLSILCSCPWILGIIADILDLDILRYIFILLAGSHGTFISIIFLRAYSVSKGIQNKLKTKNSVDVKCKILTTSL